MSDGFFQRELLESFVIFFLFYLVGEYFKVILNEGISKGFLDKKSFLKIQFVSFGSWGRQKLVFDLCIKKVGVERVVSCLIVEQGKKVLGCMSCVLEMLGNVFVFVVQMWIIQKGVGSDLC